MLVKLVNQVFEVVWDQLALSVPQESGEMPEGKVPLVMRGLKAA